MNVRRRRAQKAKRLERKRQRDAENAYRSWFVVTAPKIAADFEKRIIQGQAELDEKLVGITSRMVEKHRASLEKLGQ